MMATIDAETFRGLQDSAGREFVQELVQTFLQEAPAMVSELRLAWEARSPERFRRAAHSLKSNGQTFGATEVARLARELETGGLPASAAPLEALQASLALAGGALEEMSRA